MTEGNNGRDFKRGLTSLNRLGGSLPMMGAMAVIIIGATWFLATRVSDTKTAVTEAKNELRQEMHVIGAKTDLNSWRIKALEEWRERKRNQ